MRTCPWPGSWTWSVASAQAALGGVELHLNRLRWLYLRAIALSPRLRDAPAQALSVPFNGAFLSLAGVDQTPAWQHVGFAPEARYGLDWGGVRRDLAAALAVLSQQPNTTAIQAEVLALKPGFHEAWVHEEFPWDVQEGPETLRGRVFAVLRGSPLARLEVGDDPRTLADAQAFLRYAPCAVTEGPLVRRRGPAVSYLTVLSRVGTLPSRDLRRTLLQESFHVLDARHHLLQENHAPTLARIIQDGTAFNLPEPP